MKLIKINPKALKLTPKAIFRSIKKSHGSRGDDDESVSKSDPPSFGSSSSAASSNSSSTSDLKSGIGSLTPQSVLPEVEFPGEDLADEFRLMDRDNDGVVSREELAKLLSGLGGSSSRDGDIVAAMLSEVDGGCGGAISVEALASRVAGGSAEPSGDSEMREIFEYFDTNRDGRISAEELLGFYEAIGDERCTLEDCRSMIKVVDRFGEGFVCFEDFSSMMEMQRL